MLPKRHLIILGVLEGVVMFSAVGRMAIPGLGLDLTQKPQLIWLVATLLLSASGASHYALRATPLMARLKGEQLESELKPILALSLAMVGLAGLLSLAGPQAFERLFG